MPHGIMTNSREMAEQAFALLQDALTESETRRLDLEERLNSSAVPASELQQAYEALRAELEEIRNERDLWKKTSGQLQDVVSNERSKARRLSKKLGIVETGADRVSRKEVNFWREKAAEFENAKLDFQRRINELREELNQRAEHEDELTADAVRAEELERLQGLLEDRETRLAELGASLEHSRILSQEQEERLTELDADVRHLRQQVIDAEAARDEARRASDLLDAELTDLRSQASARQQTVEAVQQQADEQASLNGEYQNRIDELETQHEREIAALREEQDKEIAALRESHEKALAQATSDAEQTRIATYEDRVSELTQKLESRSNEFAELEQEKLDLTSSVEALRTSNLSTEERIATLESELAAERHRSDNLNEMANERREALTKTTEKLEEMEERYEDAKWHLGKARHFERLVRRRKKLIANLIETIRARQKANTTLKAGLDSLRRYKANADERQQELLRRVEMLENSLSEARERMATTTQQRRESDMTSAAPVLEVADQEAVVDQVETAAGDGSGTESLDLRGQMRAQSEVIETLEADLKIARLAESEARSRLRELEKLHDDIETKNTFIDTLQKDIEDQQLGLAKLRKLEIEVRELRDYIEAQDRKMAALLDENKELRSAKSGEVEALDRKRIEEQQALIERLSSKIREYEDTITTLSEAADSWKRKYDFLAAETPYGYESAESAGSE